MASQPPSLVWPGHALSREGRIAEVAAVELGQTTNLQTTKGIITGIGLLARQWVSSGNSIPTFAGNRLLNMAVSGRVLHGNVCWYIGSLPISTGCTALVSQGANSGNTDMVGISVPRNRVVRTVLIESHARRPFSRARCCAVVKLDCEPDTALNPLQGNVSIASFWELSWLHARQGDSMSFEVWPGFGSGGISDTIQTDAPKSTTRAVTVVGRLTIEIMAALPAQVNVGDTFAVPVQVYSPSGASMKGWQVSVSLLPQVSTRSATSGRGRSDSAALMLWAVSAAPAVCSLELLPRSAAPGHHIVDCPCAYNLARELRKSHEAPAVWTKV